jgi:hypothetical protein
LPVAYQLAATKLGLATNQFHCVSAKLSDDFGGPGWYFYFSPTNASIMQRCFCVELDGTVIEEDFTKMQ